MNAAALTALLRLRSLAVDDARRVLADRLRAETRAEADARLAETAIAEETARATSLDGDDGAVEAFAAWLKRARVHLDQARGIHAESAAATTQGRAVLAVARRSLEAAREVLATHLAEQRASIERRLQTEMDEAARTAHQRNR
jgi:hypothetical protein